MAPFLKFKNKFAKERFVAGLDIGTQTIKFVKLRFSKDGAEFCAFDFHPNQNDIREVLKKIKESQGIGTVNIGISGPSTVIRYVNFPRMNIDELKQALKFEAQKHIPFSVDETNLDAYILKEDLPDNKMVVLIAAVKKDFINQRLKIIEDAGFRANIIDIDSMALVNAFNFNYSPDNNLQHKAIALLNIGASTTNLDILEDGLPRLSRDIHIAGNKFNQKLVDIFGIDFKAAEELKLNPVRNTKDIEVQNKISNGVNPDTERANKVAAAIELVLSNLAVEIRTSFDYYESQSTSSVVKIFLSGGCSRFSGLKDMLANLLGIEVEYWDPLKKFTLANNIDSKKLQELSSQLPVAIGLALRQ